MFTYVNYHRVQTICKSIARKLGLQTRETVGEVRQTCAQPRIGIPSGPTKVFIAMAMKGDSK